ncbi:MAG: CDP-alcohol phosphatidyltransferase family protein, partial [Oscillospiraceae bacterium]
MNTPNKLTLFRVVLIPLYMFLFLLCGNIGIYFAIAVFVIATLTDTLDGYLARKNNQVTTFGKLMDPLADKLLVTAALLILLEWGK